MLDKLFIQRTYADQLGSRLELFRVQSYSPYRSNFRCPICGDSQKNKHRKRAYILEHNQHLVFHCHNECGSMGFETFLKDYFGDIYAVYRIDLLKNLNLERRREEKEEEYEEIDLSEPTDIEIDLPLVSTHTQAYQYLKNRQIPEKFFEDIYYTDKFHKFVNSISPGKFEETMERVTEPRIVLPMRDSDDNIFGVISRSMLPQAQMRYLTIKFDDDKPKLFGLERLNQNMLAYVTEGPIDSFFVSNCIALAGTDGNPNEIFPSKEDYVMILDNQPRSKSVILKYEKYIRMGCKMFIWPTKIKSKDINDCIRHENMNIQDVNKMIRLNTYTGLKLKIMFNEWKRV